MSSTLSPKSLNFAAIIVAVLMIVGISSDMGKLSSLQNHFGGIALSQFITKNNTRVVAQKGGLAILPCVLKINSPATVSWIRRKDFQLLTVGLSTHSSDKRFLVEHTRHMGHWSLRIKAVKEDDRGLYECQLSIYPTQSIFLELNVVEAEAEIAGAPDLHIDEGSTLRLECKLKRATENPAFVFWYRNNKMVNFDTQDGFSVASLTPNSLFVTNGRSTNISGALTRKERSEYQQITLLPPNNQSISFLLSSTSTSQQLPSYLPTLLMSVLTIQEVHFHHAGNYTCSPSNARAASITVHVLRGEKPAAMQHSNRSTLNTAINNSSSLTNELSSKSSASAFYVHEPLGVVLGSMIKQLFRNHLYKISFWQLLVIVALIFSNKKTER